MSTSRSLYFGPFLIIFTLDDYSSPLHLQSLDFEVNPIQAGIRSAQRQLALFVTKTAYPIAVQLDAHTTDINTQGITPLIIFPSVD